MSNKNTTDFNVNNRKCVICGTVMKPNGNFNVSELISRIYDSFHISYDASDQETGNDVETTLFECPGCKLGMFLPHIPAPDHFYEKLSKIPGYYPLDRWDFREALSDIKSTDVVLDVGCGAGCFLARARLKTNQVMGCEENEKGREKCIEKGIKVYKSLSDIRAKNMQLNAVFAFQVLEHVFDPVEFVSELAALVPSGGTVGLSVPNMNGILRHLNPCYSNMPPHHASQWREETIRALAERTDLELVRIAFEPLGRMHLLHYAKAWASKIFKGDSFVTKCIRSMCEKFFYGGLLLLYIILLAIGVKGIPFLQDMSLYVRLKKRR